MIAIEAFTITRANQSLVYVSRVVDDVVQQYRDVLDLRESLDRLRGKAQPELDRDYEKAMDRLGELVEELHAVGVELKDFERGEIEFPAEVDGDEVMLHWEPGCSHVLVPVGA